MSKAEAASLIDLGKHWYIFVRGLTTRSNIVLRSTRARTITQRVADADSIAEAIQQRDAVLAHLGEQFRQAGLPVRFSRGYQSDDPVVRVNNKAHTYATLAAWASGQPDGGVAAAVKFQKWYDTDEVSLTQLEENLLALAVITHFAEVARGFTSALKDELYPWVADMTHGPKATTAALWRAYRDAYKPSLKYAEDAKDDYEPMQD